jgi:hypothetical protein
MCSNNGRTRNILTSRSNNRVYYSLYYFLVFLLVESLQIIFRISDLHVNMTNKYRICPRIFAAVFCMNWKRAGNFVKLFCLDKGFCCFGSFWFQLDCSCYRMNNKRIIEFGLRRISQNYSNLGQHYHNADLGLNNSDILPSLIQ